MRTVAHPTAELRHHHSGLHKHGAAMKLALEVALGVLLGGLALDGVHYLQLAYTSTTTTPHAHNTTKAAAGYHGPLQDPPGTAQNRTNGWPGPAPTVVVPRDEEIDGWIANHTPR